MTRVVGFVGLLVLLNAVRFCLVWILVVGFVMLCFLICLLVNACCLVADGWFLWVVALVVWFLWVLCCCLLILFCVIGGIVVFVGFDC